MAGDLGGPNVDLTGGLTGKNLLTVAPSNRNDPPWKEGQKIDGNEGSDRLVVMTMKTLRLVSVRPGAGPRNGRSGEVSTAR